MRPVRTLRNIGTAVVVMAVAIVTGGATAVPAVADEAVTTLLSSDFESGTATPWVGRGGMTLAVTTADAHAGTHALLSTGSTGSWNGPATDISALAPAGQPV
ncbi:MAG: carbohydrate binding domain-containing protein, partial [Brevundimonas sp.]